MRLLFFAGARATQYLERNRKAKAAIEQKPQLPLALQAIGWGRAKPFAPKGERGIQVATVKTRSRLRDHVVTDSAARHLLPDASRACSRAARANDLVGKS